MTGLLVCLSVNLFPPSFSKSAKQRIGMSCILPKFRLADKIIIKEMGDFIDEKDERLSVGIPIFC